MNFSAFTNIFSRLVNISRCINNSGKSESAVDRYIESGLHLCITEFFAHLTSVDVRMFQSSWKHSGEKKLFEDVLGVSLCIEEIFIILPIHLSPTKWLSVQTYKIHLTVHRSPLTVLLPNSRRQKFVCIFSKKKKKKKKKKINK